MIRRLTLCPLAAVVWLAAADPASAQLRARSPALSERSESKGSLQRVAVAQVAAAAQADLRGTVLDERGQPLAGAVISALGSTTAFAVSDREGRFALRNLPVGPYLVRAHLQGYIPARARIIQVDHSTRTISAIALIRRPDADAPPQMLAAGVGTAGVEPDPAGESAAETHDHSEVAWRLRHLKRSVLKDAAWDIMDGSDDSSFLDGSVATFGRAVGTPARYATSLFTDLPVTGQVNLLTRTSFDRPQDLFSPETWAPSGIAFVSLQAPAGNGDWRMRGALTQGDLSSWIVEGMYVRRAPATHRYEAGFSYGMQRYLGGNADALAAVTDGERNVGAIYAYDDWTVHPRVSVSYGAKYARYDYLTQQGLLSPRASLALAVLEDDPLRVRATVSRRELAPGAEEFIPPSTGLWLPPERTFSPLSRNGFASERIDHIEIAVERPYMGNVLIGGRVFRQRVSDQLVTLFGVSPTGTASATVGHYYVASGGDFEARGWGVSVSRAVSAGIRASVDYTRVDSSWLRTSPDEITLSAVAASGLRDDERIHDFTTSVESVVPITETRVFVIYKINSRFADTSARYPRPGARFDVQLNQSLPFLDFTNAEWEMLVAVRNLFREELLDASVYDELLVLRPPKRVVGGVTVRF